MNHFFSIADKSITFTKSEASSGELPTECLNFLNMFQTLFEYYDEHYLKKIFCKQRPEHDLQRLFEKLALS